MTHSRLNGHLSPLKQQENQAGFNTSVEMLAISYTHVPLTTHLL